MKKLATLAALVAAAALVLVAIPGCSKDDNTVKPPSGPDKIYIQLKPNSQFTYTRTDIDTLNNTVPGSARNYTVNLKSNGGLILGAFNDWFYRIGTDAKSLKKDTLNLRTETGSANNVSFTKEIQVYGFATKMMQTFVDLIVANVPGVSPPSVAGPQWDVIASYQDQDGNAFPIGHTWTIINAQELQFNILTGHISIFVTAVGKLESYSEAFSISGHALNAWKSTITVTATVLGTPVVITLTSWFSDSQYGRGQIKVIQSGTKFIVPLVNISIPIPGEMQELQNYIE